MNDVEIIDLHARSCPATYAELLAKYSAVCKERDELADAYRKMCDVATEAVDQRDYFMRRLMEVENNG